MEYLRRQDDYYEMRREIFHPPPEIEKLFGIERIDHWDGAATYGSVPITNKYSIPVATIIKHYYEEYCVKCTCSCANYNCKDYEKLYDTGGIPIGLFVMKYDCVLGRLIIADNSNIQALYL